MIKVLLLQGTIPHYRVPIFNLLSQHVNLTVVYSYGELPDGISFQCLKIPTIKFHYKFHKSSILRLANYYDVVICMMDFSYFSFRMLKELPRKYKLIYWGIGVSASYVSRFDQDQSGTPYVLRAINKADAVLFYSDYPIKKYEKLGIPIEKLFVANNTVYVKHEMPKKTYKNILFIGSLYKQKRIDILLEHYIAAYRGNTHIPKLIIIGDGDQYEIIAEQIRSAKMEDTITLAGNITDEEVLQEYFSEAIACISPDQAGLSVLKAMGYGVPYVTGNNAITGGEIFNIHNNVDGIIVDDFCELKELILNMNDNLERYIEMSKNARLHYWKNRRPEQMVQGFLDAITYVLNTKSAIVMR